MKMEKKNKNGILRISFIQFLETKLNNFQLTGTKTRKFQENNLKQTYILNLQIFIIWSANDSSVQISYTTICIWGMEIYGNLQFFKIQ